eukprot:scaffold24157_cov36-Phaeocystis_antarctica.AAC.1
MSIHPSLQLQQNDNNNLGPRRTGVYHSFAPNKRYNNNSPLPHLARPTCLAPLDGTSWAPRPSRPMLCKKQRISGVGHNGSASGRPEAPRFGQLAGKSSPGAVWPVIYRPCFSHSHRYISTAAPLST